MSCSIFRVNNKTMFTTTGLEVSELKSAFIVKSGSLACGFVSVCQLMCVKYISVVHPLIYIVFQVKS